MKNRRNNQQAQTRRRRVFASITLLVIAGYVTTMLLWPVQAIQASIHVPNPIPATEIGLDLPDGAQSALGEVSYGELEGSAPQTPVPMASITKLVTALTVLDARPLEPGIAGPDITFTTEDVTLYNTYLAQQGVVGPVTPGQSISQYDMLQITLVPSANNYADRLAIWAFGSMKNYLTAANNYLNREGFTQTSVADASGFSPDSVSTASELLKLARLALTNEVIAQIVDKPSVTVDGFGTFYSTNLLIRADDIIGVKTGTTDEAGNCLVYGASYDVDGHPITVIGATLNAPGRVSLAQQAESALQQARDGFSTRQIAHPNDKFATYRSEWGATVSLQPVTKVTTPTYAGLEGSYSLTASDLVPGEEASFSASFQSGGKILSIPLQLNEPLSEPSWFWRLTNPHKLL